MKHHLCGERLNKNLTTTMSTNVSTAMTNGTLLLSCFSNITATKIGTLFAFSLILVISLAGNSLIGIIVYKTKTMRKSINFLIVNMAMSDLLYSVLGFPEVLARMINSPGQIFCKLAIFLPSVSLTVSVQSLVLIAVDRFGAVVFPLRSPLISSKLCPFFILATWIVAMATSSPVLVADKLVEYPSGVVCRLQWNEVVGEFSSVPLYYNLAVNIVFICAPLLLIAVLYTAILLKLKLQKIPGEQTSSVAQRVKRERNVLKMAIAIVLGFAVSWLPLSASWFVLAFESGIRFCDLAYLVFVAAFLAYANCAINPCICFIFSSSYRLGLKKLFRCF